MNSVTVCQALMMFAFKILPQVVWKVVLNAFNGKVALNISSSSSGPSVKLYPLYKVVACPSMDNESVWFCTNLYVSSVTPRENMANMSDTKGT